MYVIGDESNEFINNTPWCLKKKKNKMVINQETKIYSVYNPSTVFLFLYGLSAIYASSIQKAKKCGRVIISPSIYADFSDQLFCNFIPDHPSSVSFNSVFYM